MPHVSGTRTDSPSLMCQPDVCPAWSGTVRLARPAKQHSWYGQHTKQNKTKQSQFLRSIFRKTAVNDTKSTFGSKAQLNGPKDSRLAKAQAFGRSQRPTHTHTRSLPCRPPTPPSGAAVRVSEACHLHTHTHTHTGSRTRRTHPSNSSRPPHVFSSPPPFGPHGDRAGAMPSLSLSLSLSLSALRLSTGAAMPVSDRIGSDVRLGRSQQPGPRRCLPREEGEGGGSRARRA